MTAARKNAPSARRDGEVAARYRELVEMSPDAILLAEDGVMRFANPVGLALLRASCAEEVAGRPIEALLRHEDGTGPPAWLAGLLREAGSAAGEAILHPLDGGEVPVEVRARSYLDHGRMVVLAFCRERPAGAQAGETDPELRESLARFHAIARATGDVVWDWDLATDSLWWNDNFQFLFGYAAREIEPTIESWTNRIHPDDHDRVIAKIHAAIDGGRRTWSDEYRFRRKNGSYAEIFDRGQVLRDPSGRGARMVGMMQDITGRKQTEDALREKSALLEAVVESAGTGILVVNPDGQKLVHNQRLYELFRIPSEIADDPRVAPQFEFATTQAKDPAAWIGMAASLASRPEAIERFEIELIDGRILDSYTAPVHDKEGRRYGRAWIFEDITERRRDIHRLRQAERVEAVGSFAAGIAHDLGNMLVPIMVTAERISGGVADPEGKARIILSAADQAKTLVEQILEFTGQRRAVREPIDLRTPVSRAIELLGSTLPEGVVVERQLPDRPATVSGDATQLLRLTLNLCRNAIQAMGDTPSDRPARLIVRVEEGHADAAFAHAHPPLPAGPAMILSVEDNGPGMDAATLERIFEPFFSTKGSRGTGLGLALVQSIAAQHEGAVTVDTIPGKGATFRIWLPKAQPAVAAEPTSPPPRTGAARNILVVDDRPEIAKTLVELLEADGHSAEAIEDPFAARDRIAMLPGRFDLVITDYHMPGMTGAELVAGVRFACPDLPFILTSGQMPPIDPELAASFVAFLPKPFTAKTVQEACAAAIDGQASIAAAKAAGASIITKCPHPPSSS
ncbi:PAS domain S-box protein [Rhizorhabdus histidinilytica]|uniref:PAS domain S-box protein n=1 Tax=Rhizorhabdus histidinilytica TaxID=439228 RepID=UPI00321FB6FC